MTLSVIAPLLFAFFSVAEPCRFAEPRQPCATIYDTVTRKVVYTSADVLPENEGGQALLSRKWAKISVPDITPDTDTKFTIAFVVHENGAISGERVLHDETNSAGKQMLQLVKECKWKPARCDGRKVPFLHKVTMQACLGAE